MSFPRYPEYKASGVDWLGDVPSHWVSWKLSHSYKTISSGTTPKSDNTVYYENGDIPWVNTGDLTDGILLEPSKFITLKALEDHTSLKLYPSGAIIFAMYGATIGKIAKLDFEATVNQACCVFTESNIILNDFLKYWFLGMRNHILSLATGGGQPNVSQDVLRKLRVACPSMPEQQVIANFLDRETAKIDGLIEEQRRLVELLKEKRQAVISHAVTKGLNPNAPMKPSGIEWLGDIPEHWEIINVRNMIRLEYLTLQDGNHGEIHPKVSDYQPTGIPFVMASNLINGVVDFENCNFISEEKAKGLRVSPSIIGDVLLSTKGTLGEVALVSDLIDYPFIVLTPQITFYRSNYPEKINRLFVLNYLQSFGIQHQMSVLSCHQATRPSVSLMTQRELLFVIPPVDEQIAINNYLMKENEKFVILQSEAEKSICLFQERRTALISAAVTGKIDVRGLAATEPGR